MLFFLRLFTFVTEEEAVTAIGSLVRLELEKKEKIN